MESLLRWGIENSAPPSNDTPPPQPRQDLDPAIIDIILGKPDSERMKEELAVATNNSAEEDARLTALDNLELLIEQIDNANNLKPLQMWTPLIALLSDHSTEIRTNTLWVLGTALQNNTQAQSDFLELHPLSKILDLIDANKTPSGACRAKAIYCLSGALKHNRDAVQQFSSSDGWGILRDSLTDPTIQVRRKAVFLLNSLLVNQEPSPPPALNGTTHDSTAVTARDEHPAFSTQTSATSDLAANAMQDTTLGLQERLIRSIVSPTSNGSEADDHDADYEEKALRALHTYVEADGIFNVGTALRDTLRTYLDGDSDTWGLSEGELRSLRDHVRG